MIEQLKQYDRQATLWINQQNAPWLDDVMWFVSSATPFLLLIFIAIFYANRKRGLYGMWIFVGFLLLAFALADLVSVRAFKEVFMRFRPSQHPELKELLHLYLQPNGEIYRGGLYGFVSSHAANFAALTTFILFNFKPKRTFLLLLILTHLLIIYSRVYLGVHYVGDVVAGSLLGFTIGWLVYLLYKKAFEPNTNL